jgi:Cysteine-rich secretory protein family
MAARFKYVIAAAAIGLLAVPSWAAGPAAPSLSVPPSRHEIPAISPELDIFNLMNRERAQAGVPPLVWDDSVAQSAQAHARLLAEHQRLSHQFDDEPALERRLGVRVRSAGENVGANYDTQAAHTAFMQSPGHRANIVSPEFDAVGIAAVRSGDLIYFVEDFVQRRSAISNVEAARIVAGQVAALRTRAGLPALQQVEDNRVQDWACADAAAGRLNSVQGRSAPGLMLLAALSSADPGQLSPELTRITGVDASSYALGVCYSPAQSSGRYFLSLAFFKGERQQAANLSHGLGHSQPSAGQ